MMTQGGMSLSPMELIDPGPSASWYLMPGGSQFAVGLGYTWRTCAGDVKGVETKDWLQFGEPKTLRPTNTIHVVVFLMFFTWGRGEFEPTFRMHSKTSRDIIWWVGALGFFDQDCRMTTEWSSTLRLHPSCSGAMCLGSPEVSLNRCSRRPEKVTNIQLKKSG